MLANGEVCLSQVTFGTRPRNHIPIVSSVETGSEQPHVPATWPLRGSTLAIYFENILWPRGPGR